MTDNTQPEALRDARWYMVDKDGMATLCTDREDAEQEAKDANMAWPHTAPHRAVQLVEVGTAAAELHRQHARITELEARVQELGAMARENRSRRIVELEAQLEAIGAGGVSGPLIGQAQAMPDLSALTERGAVAWAGVDAQGLREGVASAGSEPVAGAVLDDEGSVCLIRRGTEREYIARRGGSLLYTHPSPPEGMAGGWMPMADAPRDGTLILAAIYIHSSDGTAEWQRHAIYFDEERDCTYLDGGDDTGWEFDDYEFWTPLPPPPTTPAGNEKGE